MPLLTLVPLPGHPAQRAASSQPQIFDVAVGTRVLDAASDHGFLISTRCGGVADCKTCQVYLLEGDDGETGLGPPSEVETHALQALKASPRTRLACQAVVIADVTLQVPDPRSVEEL